MLSEKEYIDVIAKLTDIFQSEQKLLVATQSSASIHVVIRIAKKIKFGLYQPEIYVKEKKICEGHHRYLAALLLNCSVVILPGELSSSHKIFDWSTFGLSSIDFDTSMQIEFYISQTARDNGLDRQSIRNILNKPLDL